MRDVKGVERASCETCSMKKGNKGTVHVLGRRNICSGFVDGLEIRSQNRKKPDFDSKDDAVEHQGRYKGGGCGRPGLVLLVAFRPEYLC